MTLLFRSLLTFSVVVTCLNITRIVDAEESAEVVLLGGKVLTMMFSEFGRRVAQNGSSGTDHGTAAPMFLVGDMVQPGLLGTHPSLTKLDEGDLVYNTDFRQVYASVLSDWMGADDKAILGNSYTKAKVLK